MESKVQALKDLYHGMIRKVGDTSSNRVIVSTEIEKLVKTKSKLSVKDLDNLETQIFQKTFNRTNENKKSLSPLRNTGKGEFFFNESLKKVSPLRSLERKNESKTPKKKQEIKIRESFISVKELGEFKNSFMGSLTPNKYFLKKKYDEWGKIIRADSVKYHKELESLKLKEKLNKLEYSNELMRQASDCKNLRAIEKKMREEEEKITYQRRQQEQSELENNVKRQKEMMKIKEKQELDEAFMRRINNQVQNLTMKMTEKDQNNQSSFEYYQEEVGKQMKRFKQKKQIANDNLYKSELKRLQQMDEKVRNLQQDLHHHETNAKTIIESEKKYKRLIEGKAQKAHNQKRLLKLIMVKPKALKEYENEASAQEMHMLQTSIERENKNDLKKIENLINKREELVKVLQVQVQERDKKNLLYKSIAKEQGEIWKRQDDIAKEEDNEKKRLKKRKQKEFKHFYDSQIQHKLEKDISEMQLSPTEKQINKDICKDKIFIE